MCDECVNRDTPQQKIAKKQYQEWFAKHFQARTEWLWRYNRATSDAERLRRTNPEMFADYVPEGRELGAKP
jgi:hypothetical protein